MKRLSVIFIAGLLLLCFPAEGQDRSSRLVPRWINNPPTPSNGSFEYVIQRAMAPSLGDARQGCLSSLIRDCGYGAGVVVKLDESSTQSFTAMTDGTVQKETFKSSTRVTSDSVRVFVREIAEYYTADKGMYNVMKLYQKSVSKEKPLFDEVVESSSYGLLPLAYSIVPGLGQFIKGDPLKGGLYLGTCCAAFAGFGICWYQADVALGKSSQSHDVSVIKMYNNQYSTYRTAAYVCLGTGAVLYILNLIDAACAPGASRVNFTGNTLKISF